MFYFYVYTSTLILMANVALTLFNQYLDSIQPKKKHINPNPHGSLDKKMF